MKYMGSKRTMLRNGLGQLILEKAPEAKRFIDLLSGSGAVSWFAAEHTQLPVSAFDLQQYAVVLANAVISRSVPLDASALADVWLSIEQRHRTRTKHWDAAKDLERMKSTRRLVGLARILCEEASRLGPVWNAYGGYYYGPTQAITFDCMLRGLPKEEPKRSVCLSATLFSASKCAASPGHTAQPFQPTDGAAVFIRQAWMKDPLVEARKALEFICPRHAQIRGSADVRDACDVAGSLRSTDLVFVDPPYSGVHYSRFYHVFETMTRMSCGSVEGAGRYPPCDERPRSDFSVKSKSTAALEKLLWSLAKAGSQVILTFPAGECSNGLSGEVVLEIAHRWFCVKREIVKGRFSTLGGNNSSRASRSASEELLLFMVPRKTTRLHKPSTA